MLHFEAARAFPDFVCTSGKCWELSDWAEVVGKDDALCGVSSPCSNGKAWGCEDTGVAAPQFTRFHVCLL